MTAEDGESAIDEGYPAPITNGDWTVGFCADRIDAALYSGPKCSFFDGAQYIRVLRGDTGAATVDDGYPAPLSNWIWHEFIRL